ncbi:hypothetical protein [Maribacter hydrothermalis]|uniref:Right handed beta helix region n=1 Tax=Maribacter hydrothermalis TaxID=1836467 RepID=A0A1B7Z826_9FLAO|nr:hypothetical protein [Maribacter hydrothermalis]APQ19136.1 hypothetical protein BTR34_18210 [Maribacter hydrothermalis]OBR38853.1 hypothetical protein A9200_04075 [Maribacter hydrothermalis]
MLTRIIIALLVLFGILWSTSCRKDFEYTQSQGNLTFSKDTVYLDTVFASIGSSTYTLKVYNNSKDDILIPSISLKNGTESFYNLNVDGVAGKAFNNVPLYAQDSLFVLIETTIEITDTTISELIYTDAIQFNSKSHQQSVELVTLAKDAIFLFPKKNDEFNTETITLYNDELGKPIQVNGFNLTNEELNFTNNKAYVIYGYAIVPEGKELIIDAGARVHFHKDAGLYVQNNAKITINGELSTNEELLEGEVIFEGDRLEPEYEDLPGQWGTVWISAGSTQNYINHLTVKNGQIGLHAEGATTNTENTLLIENSKIFNNSRNNLWLKNAEVQASNLILGGAGKASLLIENGGNYSFIHSTIANYWTKGFRINASLEISNASFTDPEIGYDLESANFKNSIIDGNNLNEMRLTANGTNAFNFNFQNCFIKLLENQNTNNAVNLYYFTNTEWYADILFNVEADYFLPSKNDFRIGLVSKLINMGDIDAATTTPIDILGTPRLPAPDLGAFQAKQKN